MILNIHTPKKSKLLVAGIVLFTIPLHAHLPYGHDITEDICSGAIFCGYRLKEYHAFMVMVWTWVDLLLFSSLPGVCLIISNSLLIWKLTISLHDARASLDHGQEDIIRKQEQKATSVTVTLILVSVTFLTLTLPMSCFQILTVYHWLQGTLDEFYTTEIMS